MEKSETEPGRIGRNPVSRPFRPRLKKNTSTYAKFDIRGSRFFFFDLHFVMHFHYAMSVYVCIAH